MIKLGDIVADKITGFEGTVIGITKWLHGCDTCGIKTKEFKDGKPIETVWMDILRLEKKEERVSEIKPPGQGIG